jgi:ABC-type transporter MlaC component
MVHTLVSFKDAEDMRVKYRLCNDQGAWKIYDVVVDSVLSHMKDAVLQALEAIFELFGDTSDVKRPPQRPG